MNYETYTEPTEIHILSQTIILFVIINLIILELYLMEKIMHAVKLNATDLTFTLPYISI
jgi:uncharacterized membrane protein required for colicin V production